MTRPSAERHTPVRTAERAMVPLAIAGDGSREYCTPRSGTRSETRRKTRIGTLAGSGAKKYGAARCSDGLRGPRVVERVEAPGAQKIVQSGTDIRTTSLLAGGDTWWLVLQQGPLSR